MNQSGLLLKIQAIRTVFFVLFLSLPFSLSHAANCCSQHGGVSGCNKATGYQLCKDGTDSPSCTCKKGKASSKAVTKTKKAAIPTTANTATGCCSNHNGVSQCNKATGYQMCKDGSQSSSCRCK